MQDSKRQFDGVKINLYGFPMFLQANFGVICKVEK